MALDNHSYTLTSPDHKGPPETATLNLEWCDSVSAMWLVPMMTGLMRPKRKRPNNRRFTNSRRRFSRSPFPHFATMGTGTHASLSVSNRLSAIFIQNLFLHCCPWCKKQPLSPPPSPEREREERKKREERDSRRQKREEREEREERLEERERERQ